MRNKLDQAETFANAAQPSGSRARNLIGVSPVVVCYRPETISDHWRSHILPSEHFNAEVECLWGFALDSRFIIKKHFLISVGTQTETLAHPREIYRAAILASAFAIVIAHNHPCNDPRPTSADILTTEICSAAGEIVGVPLLDHLILADSGFFSFRKNGYL